MLRRSIAVVAATIALAGLGALPVQSAVVVKATFNREGRPVFKPKRVEIARGTRVVWKSVSGNHTVTAYGGGWSKDTSIPQGTQTGFTFQSRGTFKYVCDLHGDVVGGVCSGMCGRVIVG